jgi:hypothetical protein
LTALRDRFQLHLLTADTHGMQHQIDRGSHRTGSQ